MILPGWFPAGGAARRVPQFNLVEAGVDTADDIAYGRTFSVPNVRPDRYIVVLSSTGKNSGTTTVADESLGGQAPSGLAVQNSRTAVSVAYRHYPTGTTIDYDLLLNSVQTAWVFACFEVWGLHPSPIVATRSGTGNIAVQADGLLFASAAGGDPGLAINNMTLLSENDGSDVAREVRYKSDFLTDQTFNIQTSGSASALVGLSIR